MEMNELHRCALGAQSNSLTMKPVQALGVRAAHLVNSRHGGRAEQALRSSLS